MDTETAKMLVGAALVLAIGAFSVLTMVGVIHDMVSDLRAGRAERRSGPSEAHRA